MKALDESILMVLFVFYWRVHERNLKVFNEYIKGSLCPFFLVNETKGVTTQMQEYILVAACVIVKRVHFLVNQN